MRVETITWLPFDKKSTPDNDGKYLFQDKKGDVWVSDYECGDHDYKCSIDDGVIAYAELPQPYTDSPIFNFQTALAMMKEGKECRRVGYKEKYCLRDNYFIRGFDECQTWTGAELTFAEVTGEWELT